MRPRLLHLRPRRAGITVIRVRMSAAIRLVRIMPGEPDHLNGAHVRPHRVRQPARRRVRPRGPRLGLLAAVVGVAVAAAAAVEGEV